MEIARSDRVEWIGGRNGRTQASGTMLSPDSSRTIGWRPTCSCPPHEPVPSTCLDPFAGSGTVGLVANQLGRDAILVELNPTYAAMAERRIGEGLRPATYRDDASGVSAGTLWDGAPCDGTSDGVRLHDSDTVDGSCNADSRN
jgi:hypothetical protein